MSGHSKWATIKRAKATTDAKRGAVFTKLGNLITVAVREKGSDPGVNFSLRVAIDKARQANMPKENIERAVKRGTGELAGNQIEELIYEGIGPANSQFIIRCLTDNKNRSAATVRHLLSKYGGSLGAVMWNFEKKGVIRILKEEFKEFNDEFELKLIEAGAQDIKKEEEGVTIISDVQDLQKLRNFFETKEIKIENSDIEYIAKDEVKLNEEEKDKINKLIEELEDNEDVSDYYTNADV
jgi:YebC/PmpR family DNA-binding regulatory protein